MGCTDHVDGINDLVDDALGAAERRAVERHLETCADCRALAADLRAIRRTAADLERLRPPASAWSRIAAAVERQNEARARSGRAWRIALPAAAVVLLAVSAGLVLEKRRQDAPTHVAVAPAPHRENATAEERTAPPGRDLVQSVETELRLAEGHYEKAIAGLEAISKAEQATLDPRLAATLQKNLAVIDQAISESRAALRAQPESQPAQESLFEAFRSKVALLQDTVALINEMRKGNQAEAARIVGGGFTR